MNLANLRNKPCVFAAPLAGISDIAYRAIVKRMGADYAFAEMIASEGLIRDNRRTVEMLRRYPGETNVGCQLFGTRPEAIADAALMAQEFGFDSVDLNCGCPVHKVVDKNGGSALLKDLPLLEKIVKTVVSKISIPLSIKIRSGWDSRSLSFLEIGKIAEESGVSYVCLHARTQKEAFSTTTHWEHIRELKESISIPVIGNGGIRTAQDALRMIDETGCDGVMVASATLGNPFIFREIKALLVTGKPAPHADNEERISVCLEHVKGIVDLCGEETGVRRSRKLLGWYYRGMTGRSKIDPNLFKVNTFAEVEYYLRLAVASYRESAA